MKHKSFRRFVQLDPVLDLIVLANHSERRDRKRLSFASREQCRAVNFREDIKLARYGTYLIHLAAVNANMLVDDDPAHDCFNSLVNERFDVICFVGGLCDEFAEMFLGFGFDFVYFLLARLLLVDPDRLINFAVEIFAYPVLDLGNFFGLWNFD